MHHVRSRTFNEVLTIIQRFPLYIRSVLVFCSVSESACVLLWCYSLGRGSRATKQQTPARRRHPKQHLQGNVRQILKKIPIRRIAWNAGVGKCVSPCLPDSERKLSANPSMQTTGTTTVTDHAKPPPFGNLPYLSNPLRNRFSSRYHHLMFAGRFPTIPTSPYWVSTCICLSHLTQENDQMRQFWLRSDHNLTK